MVHDWSFSNFKDRVGPALAFWALALGINGKMLFQKGKSAGPNGTSLRIQMFRWIPYPSPLGCEQSAPDLTVRWQAVCALIAHIHDRPPRCVTLTPSIKPL